SSSQILPPIMGVLWLLRDRHLPMSLHISAHCLLTMSMLSTSSVSRARWLVAATTFHRELPRPALSPQQAHQSQHSKGNATLVLFHANHRCQERRLLLFHRLSNPLNSICRRRVANCPLQQHLSQP